MRFLLYWIHGDKWHLSSGDISFYTQFNNNKKSRKKLGSLGLSQYKIAVKKLFVNHKISSSGKMVPLLQSKCEFNLLIEIGRVQRISLKILPTYCRAPLSFFDHVSSNIFTGNYLLCGLKKSLRTGMHFCCPEKKNSSHC